jgi:hypothetical protein
MMDIVTMATELNIHFKRIDSHIKRISIEQILITCIFPSTQKESYLQRTEDNTNMDSKKVFLDQFTSSHLMNLLTTFKT